MKKPRLDSFGPVSLYGDVIKLTYGNPYAWRKISRMLSKLRRQGQPRLSVWRENQLKVLFESASAALNDTVLPPNVKDALKSAMNTEFKFNFEVTASLGPTVQEIQKRFEGL